MYSDWLPVSHNADLYVPIAPSVDKPPDGAGQESKHAGGGLVADVADPGVADVEMLTIHSADAAAPEEGLETVEDEGEEDEAGDKLDTAREHIWTLIH